MVVQKNQSEHLTYYPCLMISRFILYVAYVRGP